MNGSGCDSGAQGGSAFPSDLQFYKTPDWLADKAWSLFKSRDFERVLDACAGTGALADAWAREMANKSRYSQRELPVDSIEVDGNHHPVLREKGYNVVGMNFLDFEGGAIYSHVVLNPPFSSGAKHVLKAWDMLWEGEVVAIINAETIRNPQSAERKRLVQLIEQHGSCEFIADAFRGPEVSREAQVEIALLHLIKPAECADDWIGPVIESLAVDRNEEGEFRLPNELALPASFVENQCTAFRMAVKAMRESVRSSAVASHFAARIGRTMAEVHGSGDTSAEDAAGASVRKMLCASYLELKDRAWTSVLRSTETLSKLSRKVQQQAESQFAAIRTLEFSPSNVHGFLLGLVQSQPEMQLDMACDVFDQISRYHSENAVFYRGWKSNDRHRTFGMRIKTTRFILPNHSSTSWSKSLSWESEQVLADFDKVFAMLDGKLAPEVGLRDVFNKHMGDLRAGLRVSSSYFDVRYHPGVGTIHFFARDKEIVDRLNRVVGRRRRWVPPPTQTGVDTFWTQFDRAEKLDKEVREAARLLAKKARGGGYYSRYENPTEDATCPGRDGHEAAKGFMVQAIDEVLARHNLLDALTMEEKAAETENLPAQMLLLAA